MANGKFGAKEVMDVTLYDMVTGRPVMSFDTLKTSSIEVTTEKVDARGGKGNPKLITWELNKEATLTIEDALLSPKSMELISGLATKKGKQVVPIRQRNEYDTTGTTPVDKGSSYPLTADETGKITLAYAPVGTVENIFVYEQDKDCEEAVDMADATLSGKELTIASVAGKKVIVYYDFETTETAETYVIDSSHFAGTYKLVGTTFVRNAITKQDEPFVVIIPNLKWTSNLNLELTADGDPSTTTFECEILRSANSDEMIKMIKHEG